MIHSGIFARRQKKEQTPTTPMRCSWHMLQGINKKLFDPTASMLHLSSLWFPRTSGTACLEGRFFLYIYFQVYKSQELFQQPALEPYQGEYLLLHKYNWAPATRTQDQGLRLSRSERNSHPQTPTLVQHFLGVEQHQESLMHPGPGDSQRNGCNYPPALPSCL